MALSYAEESKFAMCSRCLGTWQVDC